MITINKKIKFWSTNQGITVIYSGMLQHSLGREVIFLSLQNFISPALDLMPCLQARGTRDCKKAFNEYSAWVHSIKWNQEGKY